MGFYPSYAYHNHQGYDPFYAQQRWVNRQDSGWEQNQESQFRNRRDNEDARPPRTLAAQNELAKSGKAKDEGFAVAAPVSQLTGSKDKPLRFEPVAKSEREKLGQGGKAIDTHRGERQKLEAGAGGDPAKGTVGAAAPAKVKLPASPIVAKAPDQLGADQAPPKIHETPKPDLKTEPKPALKVEPKPEARPAVKDEAKPTPKAVPKSSPKDEPAAEPKREPKAAPRAEPKPAPKSEPRPAPKAEPKPEAKPAPRAEPKPESKPEPKPAPKAESKPEPKPAPKPEPKK